MRPDNNRKSNDKFSSKGNNRDFGKKKDFDPEKKPSVFDRAFQDPDKARKQREREELIGPREERVFSKSIDDNNNPKYGSNPLDRKASYTTKEKDKYKERFPQRAAREENTYGDRKPRFGREGKDGERGGYKPRREGSEGGFRGERKEGGYNREGGFNKDKRSGDRNEGGFRGERKEGGYNREGGFNKDKRSGDRNEGGFRGDRNEGGFRGERKEGGYNREGGFNKDKRSGDRNEGGFRGERKEGGYNREGGFNKDKRSGDRNEGGFRGERKEGGYNREGGFNKDKRSGDRNEGGFRGERKEGGYNREGGFNKDKRGGDRNEGGFRGERKEGGYNREGGFNKDRRSSDRNEGGARGERSEVAYNKDRRGAGRTEGGFNKGFKKKDEAPGLKKFEKYIKPENPRIEGMDDYKFKSRFTTFDDQNKAYTARKERGAQNKFDAPDEALENSIKADYNPEAKMPLNKYLSRSGLCSRRDAVEIVKGSRVTVNGETVTEPGYKVQETDVVLLDNKTVQLTADFIYVLMNKPKGFITTLDDPKGRRIISELYQDDIQQRIFPVGRLDRNTTGLILLTNDGDLSNQLAHPKYEIKKIYQVKLEKPVTHPDLQSILDGLELEDGIAAVDQVSYLTSKDEIGIEIHSGKNRIVRRIFEHLGYEVEKLDRVLYAGLTKKNLPKGKWRYLSRQEVINLKHLHKGK